MFIKMTCIFQISMYQRILFKIGEDKTNMLSKIAFHAENFVWLPNAEKFQLAGNNRFTAIFCLRMMLMLLCSDLNFTP